ncbi:uncharacterized protein LOC103106173 isoform X1 [Monodelphis domestica]|uniref:uncharacterized protein LOC103106173 isoform X1 n=1 Tax=Monodelphis domestica TaxID=13616 RepID=UPI0007B3FEA2|nr:uncharacterized protein LOC103106173 isoform X1 [Monodelphis domestica]
MAGTESLGHPWPLGEAGGRGVCARAPEDSAAKQRARLGLRIQLEPGKGLEGASWKPREWLKTRAESGGRISPWEGESRDRKLVGDLNGALTYAKTSRQINLVAIVLNVLLLVGVLVILFLFLLPMSKALVQNSSNPPY